MTISYQRDVGSSTAGGFTRLLFKWKGSLYALIYRELLLFQSAYILLSLIYRQLLTVNQRILFETVVKYFDSFINLIPLSFVLGFYVSYVASRWWQQFLAIPWPDKLFHSIACFVDGFDEESRILRRSLMRYMNLALILVLRSISSAVKQRFPTLEHVVEAGFMTNQEKELFQAVPCNEFNTYWIPCTWFIYRIQEAAKKGKLINNYALETIIREFCEFRAKCGLLWCYDWVSIPMVYTQVVTLATYVFFIFTVIGRQKIDTLKKGEYMRSGRMPMDIDLYIPIFTILQFFFYMGLLKVAEQLINPFGDDDEDFELNWLVDRHMKASFLGCDILMDPDRIPPMVKDYYWDKQNCPIPYTEASMHFKRKTYKGSADDMVVPENKQHMVLPEIEEEEEDRDTRHHSKLSLTSLLLDGTYNDQGGSSAGGVADFIANAAAGMAPTARSQAPSSQAFTPGSWRSAAAAQQQDPDHKTTGRTPAFPTNPGSLRSEATLTNPQQHTNPNLYNNNNKNPTTSPQQQYSQQQPVASAPSSSSLTIPEGAMSWLRRLSDQAVPSFWGTSVEESQGTATDDDDSDRRGSVAGSSAAGSQTNRRNSKLIDIVELNKAKKGKHKEKRKKDKQGFVWSPYIREEPLPRSRVPHLVQAKTESDFRPTKSFADLDEDNFKPYPTITTSPPTDHQHQTQPAIEEQPNFAIGGGQKEPNFARGGGQKEPNFIEPGANFPATLPESTTTTTTALIRTRPSTLIQPTASSSNAIQRNASSSSVPSNNGSGGVESHHKNGSRNGSSVKGQRSFDDDSLSINSFKTCPSEPNILAKLQQASQQGSTSAAIALANVAQAQSAQASSKNLGPSPLPVYSPQGRTPTNFDPARLISRHNAYAADPPIPSSASSLARSTSRASGGGTTFSGVGGGRVRWRDVSGGASSEAGARSSGASSPQQRL